MNKKILWSWAYTGAIAMFVAGIPFVVFFKKIELLTKVEIDFGYLMVITSVAFLVILPLIFSVLCLIASYAYLRSKQAGSKVGIFFSKLIPISILALILYSGIRAAVSAFLI